MRRLPPRLHWLIRWLAPAVLALIFASVLTFLYVRTRGYDASAYHENVALLRQLKQLDARWELDVLRSRMGIDSSYDSLVDPLVALNESWRRLRVIATSQRGSTRTAMERATDAYHRAVEDKTRLIEHFKSHNSVLRNSLEFLPTAAGDVTMALDASGDHRGSELTRLSAAVDEALLDSMVYAQAPSADRAADLQSALSRLADAARSPPAPVRAAVSIFVAHVETVLREQPEVNALLSDLAAVPTAADLDALDSLLGASQRQEELDAQQYRRVLLIFSAALAALLLYVAANLIRSHAEINRVNRKLEAANETLEQRVQERTRELRAAQSELVASARRVGMAEIAANVLHNVGNALNGVNVSACLIADSLRETKANGLGDAVRLMGEHANDLGDFLTQDPKGRRLPSYLGKLASALATERAAVTLELESLTRGIDYIRDIVATQQSYSGAKSLVEAVQVGDVLEAALRDNASCIAERQVTVARNWPDLPPVLLDKHLLLQTLTSLIANALKEIDAPTDSSRRLILRARVSEASGKPRLWIQVEDSDGGIPAEDLPRLFTQEFTKGRGGRGFGLHNCALAVRAMGGHISAQSAGRGEGTIFTLDLPINEVSRGQVVNL